MDHLYQDLGSRAGGAFFEVRLRGSTARVCLMDIDQYQAYLDGDDYEYHGGFFDVSPVVLEVPAYQRGEARGLNKLGEALCAGCDIEGAREAWQAALAILGQRGHPDAETVRTHLNTLDAAEAG
ncbi:DUF1883 domain-containing protein [Amycolatopsis taiwanensis]|uniref:Uncharacterized protein n=1 Tax=Amycolatopsis taiwanensis TaxID=342230 RepID=A0A9W6VJL1_9PSEU|nr:DUF1883 domain-containing protein [Amycolatopsis taiwanensis]GLY70820.1 hypothetical protein Atai01_74390 [Amycolatopsis taiwanensis]